MRVALYARYSSDLQHAASIEDQIAALKARLEAERWQLANTYTDAAVSGATLLRPGIQALLADAGAAKFDLVLTEALDRLSRNQADIARIHEQLQFNGVGIVTLSEGTISELHIGLKGTMNALYLKDLAEKTRRGLAGRVRAGKSGGGKSYGYAVPLAFDANGERVTGEMVIDTDEAVIVKRIFELYAQGRSPRAIAHVLNEDGVAGPNGAAWGPTTTNGNRRRGTGILNNELYVGRRVWNRLKYVKDPETGKRVSRLNPEADWIVEDAPELRIVPDELWRRAKARQADLDAPAQSGDASAFHDKQRPRYFWSGKLKCGQCGGGYTKISKDLLGCATSRNKGRAVCANRKNIRVDALEEHLLTSLQRHLMDPGLFAEFVDTFAKELNRLQREADGERSKMESAIKRIDWKLDKAIDAILDGAETARFKDRMHELEAEKIRLQERLAGMDEDSPMRLHPNMAHVYKEKVAALADALRADRTDHEAFESIRALLDKVILHPTEAGFAFDIEGELAAIFSLASPVNGAWRDFEIAGNHKYTAVPEALGTAALKEQIKMVAGAGFEPATFRL